MQINKKYVITKKIAGNHNVLKHISSYTYVCTITKIVVNRINFTFCIATPSATIIVNISAFMCTIFICLVTTFYKRILNYTLFLLRLINILYITIFNILPSLLFFALYLHIQRIFSYLSFYTYLLLLFSHICKYVCTHKYGIFFVHTWYLLWSPFSKTLCICYFFFRRFCHFMLLVLVSLLHSCIYSAYFFSSTTQFLTLTSLHFLLTTYLAIQSVRQAARQRDS